MTITVNQQSSINAVAMEFGSIRDEIDLIQAQVGSFSDSDRAMLQCSTKVIKIHQKIALLREKNPITILEPSNCTLWYSCNKELKKIQKLLSLHWQQALSHRTQEHQEQFYRKMEAVWNQATQGKTQGHQFFEQNLTHVLTTQAINEYLFDHHRQNFITALKQKEWQKVHSLHTISPTEMKNAIDEKIHSLCQAKGLDENANFAHLLFSVVKPDENEATALEIFSILSDYLEKTNLNSECTATKLFPDFQIKRLSEAEADQSPTQAPLPRCIRIETIIPDGPLSSEQQEMLDLAEEAMIFSLLQIRYSANFVNRPETGFNQGNYSDAELELINKWIQNGIGGKLLAQYWDTKFENRKLADFSSMFVYDWITSQIGMWFPFGNCYRLASIAFFYLLKKKLPHLRIERIGFKKQTGDHSLGLIRPRHEKNRTEPFDIKNTKTWGENTVVWDPWMRKIYTGNLAHRYLKNYIGFDKKTGLPRLEDFNPRLLNHVLEVHCTDILTVEEFLTDGLINANKQEIAFLLHDLHSASSFEEKKEIALKILNLPFVDHSYMVSSEILRTLISQLRFFVFNKIATVREKQFNRFKNKC